MTQKFTIINLKRVNLEDFGGDDDEEGGGEETPQLEDLAQVILENLKQTGEQIIIDEETGEHRLNWIRELHDYIETEF